MFGRLRVAVLLAAVLTLAGGAQAHADVSTTVTYATAGSYAFTVPAGVTSITATAIGGAGGSAGIQPGGRGATVTATLPVAPGQQLLIGVGGSAQAYPATAAGQGGGGAGGTGPIFTGAGGGGASLIGTSASSPAYGLLLVAAGGGGASDYAGGDASTAGGGGTIGGQPGTASAGGAAGVGDYTTGTPGSFGAGGAGGAGGSVAGGGGGGGYYGGGGGGGGATGGGGGGGSSFIAQDATGVSQPAPTSLAPEVTITYNVPTADESTGAISFSKTQAQGTASPEQTLTVTNNGSAPLVVSGVMAGGADPGDFLIQNRCQQPVATGSSCQVGVRFDPQAQGRRSATLTLSTNAATSPPAVTLSGTGGPQNTTKPPTKPPKHKQHRPHRRKARHKQHARGKQHARRKHRKSPRFTG